MGYRMLRPHRHRDRHVFAAEPETLVRGCLVFCQDHALVDTVLDCCGRYCSQAFFWILAHHVWGFHVSFCMWQLTIIWLVLTGL